MTGTERGVDSAQDNFRVRLQFPNGLDNLPHSQVPVGHHRLDKHYIEVLLQQQPQEIFARAAKSIEASRNASQRRRFGDKPFLEPSAAERVAVPGNKMIEHRQPARTELTADTQKPVRPQPEVKSREIVDRRINEEKV